MRDKEEIQGYFADCYVLTSNRSHDFVNELLNHFIPKRQAMGDEFEMPQNTENPNRSFGTLTQLIVHLAKSKNVPCALYWRNMENSELKGVQLFFTDDGYLICGIYCATKFPNTDIEDLYLGQLKKFCNSDIGYISYEEPPVKNKYDFITITQNKFK